MKRSHRRRVITALVLVAACHANPAGGGSDGCMPSFDCLPGEPWDGGTGDTAPRVEPACLELCQRREPSWVGRMEWTGTELVCECYDPGPVACDESDCAARCSSLGYDYWICDFVGCRCFHEPAPPADADADADVAADVDADADAGAEEASESGADEDEGDPGLEAPADADDDVME